MSAENRFDRLARAGKMIVTGDFAPLAHSLWLRWHRLEFRYADSVSKEDGNSHEHSGGPKLDQVLRSMHIPVESVALDLGVGTGIAALTLSRHFSLVVGVDLSPDLIAGARRNMARMGVRNVELHCADARTFTEGLERVTHVYMFDPFPETVMSVVMENIRRSLVGRPRPLTILYKKPVCHATILTAGFTHEHTFRPRNSHPFAVYETREVS